MSRLPSTISLMRRGATWTARARAFWLRPIGLRNSSRRISPGRGLRNSPPLAVVVDDFDMHRSSLMPNETNAPLVIDPDRVLSLPVRLQGFEPIAGRNAQVIEQPGLIQKAKLSQRDILNVRRQSSALPSRPDQFRLGIGKTLDHDEL